MTHSKFRALLREHRARERRDDERAAYLAFQFCRALGAKAKGGGELKMDHFLPGKKKAKRPAPSMETMIRFAELATWAWGGKDLRKKPNGR